RATRELHHVRITILIESAVNPPSVRYGLHGGSGITNRRGGIAVNAARVCVLVGKYRRDRGAQEHAAIVLTQQILHALVVSLNSGHDVRVEMDALERAVGQEIQFQEIKAACLEKVEVVSGHLLETGMRRIESDTVIERLQFAVRGA